MVLVVVPQLDLQSGEMENVAFTANAELIENKWGIPEPTNGNIVDAAEIDVVLVPLLCFDHSCYRVGYGKGFYDKFLSKCRPDCLKIGLSFYPPVDNVSDLGPYDIPLDYCVTPELKYGPETRKNG